MPICKFYLDFSEKTIVGNLRNDDDGFFIIQNPQFSFNTELTNIDEFYLNKSIVTCYVELK